MGGWHRGKEREVGVGVGEGRGEWGVGQEEKGEDRRGFSIGSLSLEAVLVVNRGHYPPKSITKDPMISLHVLTLGRDNGHSLHIPPITQRRRSS